MRGSRTLVVVLCLVFAVPVFADSKKVETSAATITLDGFQAEAASSFSFGVENITSDSGGSGAGTGKVKLSDFTFTKKMDAASSKLFKACATGEHIKTATIVLRDSSGNTLNQLTLTDVFVKSIQTSSDGTNVNEFISVSYAKVEFTF